MVDAVVVGAGPNGLAAALGIPLHTKHLLAQQLRRQGVAQRMQATVLFAAEVNSRQLTPARDDVMEMTIVRERCERWPAPEKQLTIGRLGTAEFEIFDQRLADFVCHWQAQRRASL